MLSYILRFFKLLDISMIALSAFVWVLCCVRIFWRGLLICFSNAESLICARSHGYVLMCLQSLENQSLDGFSLFFFSLSSNISLSLSVLGIYRVSWHFCAIYTQQGTEGLRRFMLMLEIYFVIMSIHLHVFQSLWFIYLSVSSRMVAWGKQHCCVGRIQHIFLRFRIVQAVLLLQLFLATASKGKRIFS